MAQTIDTEILSEQLRLTQELATATRDMADAMSTAAQSMGSQLDVSRQIADTLKSLLDVKGIITAIENVGEKLQQIIDMVKELGVIGSGTGKNVIVLAGNMGQLGRDAGQTGKNVEQMGAGLQKTDHDLRSFLYSFQKMNPKTWAAMIGGIKGFTSALGGIVAVSKSLFGLFKGLVSAAFNVAAAIIAIPFKLFKGLIDLANSGGGSNELAQAWEEVRDQFGSLEGEIPQTFRSLLHNSTAFQEVGLSIRKVYGSLAEYLKELNEIAKASGAIFSHFHKEIEASEGAILGIGRGMGFTAEDYGVVMGQALSFGKQLGELQLDMHKQSFDLAKDFDLVAKDINRDVVKAMKDVKRFGGATIEELNKASVYARKLGMELEKIAGLLDAFETFEGAADAVAKLNQTFNTQLDAIKLVKMQDPGQIGEEIKKQFATAGVSVDKLNRQHYSLLEGILKVDGAQVRQLISTHNQGVSMDKINQKSKEAEKRTVSQAEAMKELADAIKRTIPSGSGRQGGYFSQFFQGFTNGIRYSKDFVGLLREIKKGLREAFLAGKELGKAFVEMFPGFKDMLQGLKKILDSKNIKKLFGGITDEFKWFMKTLSSSDSPASFTMLMDRLKKRFFDFFSAGTPGGKQFLDGLKRFNKAVVTIISGMIRWMADRVKEGIMTMIDLITGKKKLTDGGTGSFLINAFAPIGEALVYAWKELSPILMDLLRRLGEKIYNFLATNLPPLISKLAPYVLGYLFTSAAISAVVSAAAVGISSLLGKALAAAFLKKNPIANATKNAAADAANAARQTKRAAIANIELGVCKQKWLALECEQSLLIAQKELAAQQIIFSSSSAAFGMKDAALLAKKFLLYAFVFGVAGVAFATAFAMMAGILAGVPGGGILAVMGLLISIAISAAILNKTLLATNPAESVKGAITMKSLAPLFYAGLVATAAVLPLALISALLGAENIIAAAAVMVAMAVAGALISKALVAVNPLLTGLATINAGPLALMFTAISLSLLPALMLAYGIISGINPSWDLLMKTVVALASIAGVSIALAYAINLAGPPAASATPMSFPLAVFFGVGAAALMIAIGVFYAIASKLGVNFKKLLMMSEALMYVSLATIPLMIAAIAASKPAPAATGGIPKLVAFVGGGLVMFVAALYFLSKIDLDLKKVLKASIALAMVSLAMIPLVGALWILSKTTFDPMSLAVGMTGLLVGIGLMLLTMLALQKMSKGEEAKDVKNLIKFTGVLMQVSIIFLLMSVVLAAMTAVGVLLIAAWPATLAGLAGMLVVFGYLIAKTKEIFDTIKEMKISPEDLKKAKGFVSIMNVVADIMTKISEIISNLKPSFLTIIGIGPDIDEIIEKATGMVTAMLGSENDGTNKNSGVMGIIRVVRDAMESIGRIPSGPAVASFAKVMSVVPEIMRAMTPSDDFIDALDDAASFDIDDVAKGVVDHINAMGTQMVAIITSLIPVVEKLTSIKVPDIKSGEVVSSMFGSIVGFIKAMSPDPALVNSFKNQRSLLGGLLGSWSSNDTDGLKETMRTYQEVFLETLRELFVGSEGFMGMGETQSIISSLFDEVQDVSFDDMKKVALLGSSLEGIAKFIGAMGTAMAATIPSLKEASMTIDASDAVDLGDVTVQMPAIESFATQLGKLGPQLNTFMSSLREGIDSFPKGVDETEFRKKLMIANQTLETVAKIPEMVATMLTALKEAEDSTGGMFGDLFAEDDPLEDALKGEELIKYLEKKKQEANPVLRVMNLMKDMFGPGGVIRDIVTNMTGMMSQEMATAEFMNKLNSLSKIFETVKIIPEIAKTVGEVLKGATPPAATSGTEGKVAEETGEIAKTSNYLTENLDALLKLINPDKGTSPILSAFDKIREFVDAKFPVGTGAEDFGKKMDMFKNMFEVLKSFPEMAKTIREINFNKITEKSGGETGNLVMGKTTSETNTERWVPNLEGAASMFTTQLDQLTTVMDRDGAFMRAMSKLKNFIDTSFPEKTGDLNKFEKKLKVVTSLFDIVKMFPEMAKTIDGMNGGGSTDAAASATAGANLAPVKDPVTFEKAIGRLATFLDSFSKADIGGFSTIITSIGTLYTKIKATKAGARGNVPIETAIPVVSKFMENISKIAGSIATLSSSISNVPPFEDKPAEGAEGGKRTFAQVSTDLSQRIQGIITDLGTFDISGQVIMLTEAINKKGAVTQMDDTSKKINTYVQSMNGFVGALNQAGHIAQIDGKVTTNLSDLSSKMSIAAENINSAAFDANLQSLNEAIGKVKALHRTFHDLGTIDIFAPLNRLVSGLGIGGKYEFDPIENKPVTLNINMQVLIKASDVEDAILMNSQSVIRENINFATQNPNDKAARAILQSNPRAALSPTAVK